MRGTITGFQPVDYVKKDTKQQVKGVTLALTYKSGDFIGEAVKEEYISDTSPFYKELAPFLSDDIDSLIGAKIFIDYNTVKRGNYTFSEIVGLEIEPVKHTEQKGA